MRRWKASTSALLPPRFLRQVEPEEKVGWGVEATQGEETREESKTAQAVLLGWGGEVVPVC